MKHLFAVIFIFTAPFAAIGAWLGGYGGLLVGASLAIAVVTLAWFNARRVILRACRARPVTAGEHSELTALVRDMSAKAGIPVPLVAISDLRTPNAFAAVTIGGGVVGVTAGLLEMLSPDEIEAVVAHEIAHLTHPARGAATLAAVLVTPLGALATASGSDLFYDPAYRRSFFRSWGGRRLRPVRDALALCTVPITALIVRVSVSRDAELEADRDGVRLTANVPALRSALRKIHALAGRVLAPVNPAVAQLLVVHPFGAPFLGRMFDAHPALETRLAALDTDTDTAKA